MYCFRCVVIQGGSDGLIRNVLLGIHSLAREIIQLVMFCELRFMLVSCNEFQSVLDAFCLNSS